MKTTETANHISVVSVKLVKEKQIHKYLEPIRKPNDAASIMRDLIGDKDRENLLVIGVDTKGNITHIEYAHRGTLTDTTIHSREIYKAAIISNSKGIIIGHNHPSGDVSPSEADNLATEKIRQAGEIIGIDLIDHIIVANDSYYSIKEKRKVKFEEKGL